VELGAVVVIVSILAVLAVVGFRKMITASHSAEATHMVNAIRVAQEAYHAETGQYANISKDKIGVTNSAGTACTNASSMYPTTAPGAVRVGWGAACSSDQCPTTGLTWASIPVHVDGPVMYGYTTIAGVADVTPPPIDLIGGKSGSSTYTITFPKATTEWFVVGACGDPNGDGIYSAYLSSSFSNEVFESNDGQ
jgi:type IV pilus assembly protein PilA